VKIRSLLCVVSHRWVPTADGHPGVVVLRCARCHAETVRSDETFETEGFPERWARKELSEIPYLDPSELDPRIRERRQDRRGDPG
jgi:hypothetical protein